MAIGSTTRWAAALAVAVPLLAVSCVEEDAGSAEDPGMAVEDWTPEYEDGELQPLPDGFPEDPITIVSVDVAGSRDGIYARTIDNALDGISPVDIIVSDEPAVQGGTMPAVGEVATRQGGTEGYQIVIGSILGGVSDFHVEPIEEEFGISVDDINFFIATERQPYVLIQRKDTPWEPTFDGLLAYIRDNPGEVQYIAPGVGSGNDIAMAWFTSHLGLELDKIPATDQEGAVAAVGAGEGDITLARVDLALNAWESDRADILLVTTEEVPEIWADLDPPVVAAKEFGKYGLPTDEDWYITAGFMAPAEVPDLHIAWLHELLAAAVETEEYQSRLDTIPGLEIDVMSVQETNQFAHDGYEFTEPIIREAGLHWEDQ
jgi:tripartite-type tricarboxylate transporter receptor subunit TctC